VRKRLVERASRLVRKDGVARTSVARVMASAKMTVGGFYKHFDSQDALVGEALAEAFRDARVLLFDGIGELSGAAFERALVSRYLSQHHFENVERGCPIAANVSELSRLPRLANAPLLEEVASLVAFAAQRIRAPLAEGSPPEAADLDGEPIHPGSAEARVWLLLSTCVGAMAVARALGKVKGPRVLAAMRQALTAEMRNGA
jgi:TetR/AcrR family transcriptional regulator, transcriptional repressor for nem operon